MINHLGELLIPSEHFVENIYPTITIELDDSYANHSDIEVATQPEIYPHDYKTGYKILCGEVANFKSEIKSKLIINTRYALAKMVYGEGNDAYKIPITMEPINGLTYL